jgi:cysteinyl-tRNA synthetase
MHMTYPTILDTIGNTPMVEIRQLNPNPHVRIFAKLEYFNPGGSIKDRPARYMIEAGEKSGNLTPGKTVVEATSGNTGIGLALVCSVKGYKLLLTMSDAVSMERQKILNARGAEIMLTPGHLGTDGAIEEVYRLAREKPETYFMADQYNNPANWQAHYHGTAVEVWEQTQGQITHLVATMGTSGTLMGMSRRLKEYNSQIRIIGVEPYLGHKIQGLKNMKEAYQPEIYDKGRLDKKINIDDEEAFDMTRRLAREEGIFVGMSSGAAMAIAAKEAEQLTEGVIVVIFPDSGERYLSTALFAVREKIEMNLFNTLTRRKEPFQSLIPGKVSMYSCGPTAHARMHIGECRRFVFSDLLSRYLDFRGFDVTHIMNITDLDDKTIEGSEAAGTSLSDFTQKHIDQFYQDVTDLGINPATCYPKASDHIQDMVSLSEQLARKGFAYEKLHSLYFDISRLADYGRLSGIDLNKIRIGATVDLDEYEKDNPRDFTLLKRSRLSELKRGIYSKTPWGNVRPSWHLQCAAMSMKYLGQSFDIHTSGRELMFPHHENEIAIAAALNGKPLARFWIHCDRVLIDGKKVDEKKPRITLESLAAMGYSGRVIRYWLLCGHYRKPLTFSRDRLDEAQKALNRLDTFMDNLDQATGSRWQREPYPEIDQLVYDIRNGFIAAMDDDLNISAALASLFTLIKQINRLIQQKTIDPEGASKIQLAIRQIDGVLHVLQTKTELLPQDIQTLIEKRNRARQEKNWTLADQIRDELVARRVVIKDGKT